MTRYKGLNTPIYSAECGGGRRDRFIFALVGNNNPNRFVFGMVNQRFQPQLVPLSYLNVRSADPISVCTGLDTNLSPRLGCGMQVNSRGKGGVGTGRIGTPLEQAGVLIYMHVIPS